MTLADMRELGGGILRTRTIAERKRAIKGQIAEIGANRHVADSDDTARSGRAPMRALLLKRLA
jgi:hypothetical protein